MPLQEAPRDRTIQTSSISFREIPDPLRISAEPGLRSAMRNIFRDFRYTQTTVSGGTWVTMSAGSRYRGYYELQSPGGADFSHQFFVTPEGTIDYYQTRIHDGITHISPAPLLSRWERLGEPTVKTDAQGNHVFYFKAISDNKLSIFPGIGQNPYKRKPLKAVIKNPY